MVITAMTFENTSPHCRQPSDCKATWGNHCRQCAGAVRQDAWTSQRDAELMQLFADGYSFSQIGAAMGMSRNAVIGRAYRIGLAKRGAGTIPPKSTRRSREKSPPVKREPKLRPPPVRPETIAMRCAEIDPLHVSLIDLQPGQCCWPYGDGPVFTFCGHPAVFGSYCGPHYDLSRRAT